MYMDSIITILYDTCNISYSKKASIDMLECVYECCSKYMS